MYVKNSRWTMTNKYKIVVQTSLTIEKLLFRQTLCTRELFLNSYFKRQLLVKFKTPIHIFVNLGILISLVQEHRKFH